MKKLLLMFLLAGCAFNLCFSQAQSKASAIMMQHLPPPTAIVHDSTGHGFNYDDWVYMVATSRRFSLKADNVHPGQYLIYPLFDADGKRIVSESMKRSKPEESEQFHSGDVFKPFNEKDMNGEKFDLKKMKGKVFVINFWYIHCPPCREEIPDLNAIAEKYKNNPDVVFLAVCLDKGYDIKSYTKDNPFNYHQIDDAQGVANKYGVHLYPTNVVVNRDGKVAYSSVGGVSTNVYWIPKTIDDALAALDSSAQ